MTSKKNRSRKKQAQKQPQKSFRRPNKLAKMSLTTFLLIFFIPLILGEILLYTGGRIASMYLFPIAWVGFWAALLYTSDWAPLIKPKEQPDKNQ